MLDTLRHETDRLLLNESEWRYSSTLIIDLNSEWLWIWLYNYIMMYVLESS